MLLSNVPISVGISFFVVGVVFLCSAISQSFKNKKESTKVTPNMQEEYEAKLEEYKERENKQ